MKNKIQFNVKNAMTFAKPVQVLQQTVLHVTNQHIYSIMTQKNVNVWKDFILTNKLKIVNNVLQTVKLASLKFISALLVNKTLS